MFSTENIIVIDHAYAIGRTEVTQHQWQLVMGDNPSEFKKCGGNCPVENISWNDAQNFIRKLNANTGKTYRLPTEAEWEYACRAGGKTNYCGGNDIDAVAWYEQNSGDTTHPVAGKQANAWGLYDMTGNAWEWVDNDPMAGHGTLATGKVSTNDKKILRGGSWEDGPQFSKIYRRNKAIPSLYGNISGLRLAESL